MNLTVFGANGRIGQLVVERGLSRGHQVTASVHSSNPFHAHPSLSVTEVDVFDSNSVTNAVANSDAVISCLGSWGTDSKNILTQGMKAILPAMKKHDQSRIVSLTGSAALLPDEKPTFLEKLNRSALMLIAANIVRDAEQHLKLLSDSDLNWSVVRAPAMNGLGSSEYKLSDKSPWPTQTINRQAVASALLDLAESEKCLKQAPFVIRG